MELLRQQFATQLFREAKAFHSKRSLSPLDTEWLSSATLEDDRSELVQRLRALQSRVQQAEASFVEASDELLEEIREMTASLNEISAVVPKCAARLCFQVEKALAELESRFQAARQVEKEEVGTSLPVTGGHTADILRLSCEQADAVEHPHSLFLQGRSGTGKTLVLIHRIIGRREKAEKEGRPMPSQLFVTKSLLLKDSVVQQLSSAGVPVTSVMGSVASPQSGVMCLSWNQLASHFGAGSAMSFSVFEVQIFPSLQAACGGLSALSAKTVWTEFTCALRPFTGWHWNGISLDDYLKNEVSGQGVQLTPSNRRAIHRAFSMYTIIKERTGQRDEVDAAMTLRDLLSNRSWYDEVYVDEVQDFAPAQLSAFIQMCRRPDGFTVAGDTCQTINPGCAFCFADIIDAHRRSQELQGLSWPPVSLLTSMSVVTIVALGMTHDLESLHSRFLWSSVVTCNLNLKKSGSNLPTQTFQKTPRHHQTPVDKPI